MSDSTTNQNGRAQAGILLNDNILFHLKSASPWLRFLGIVCYIVCGLLAAGGLIMLIAAPLMDSLDIGGEVGLLAGIVYLALAVLIFFPARFMYSFGARLRNYFLSDSEKELELAFKYNKSLWKFYGIILIIVLALIPVGISLAVYASMAGYF
jgi:hypothetical protein